MWWRRLLAVLTCVVAISSQPLTQQVSDAQAPIECCPCPGSERAALMDSLGSALQPTESALIGKETDVDDCPCRVRDADSDGAPSLSLPTVLRPLLPDVKSEDKNEDLKPLLHPEVDLASSVLETLREATEEEYQEALARDAARNAARTSANEPLHQVTEPGNADIVTIIVNPKPDEEEDIIISEASHVQESRCDHPLSNSRSDLGQVRSKTPTFPSKGLLRLPKFESKRLLHRPFDMHNSASNVEEPVVSENRGLESLKLKSSPSKLSEFLKRAKSQISETSNIDGNKKYFTSPKVPNFRLDSLLKNQNEQSDNKSNGNQHHNVFPNIKVYRGKTTIWDSMSDVDSSTSPSKVHKQLSESLNQKPERINLKSFLVKDTNKGPTHLKSLLKLKDFELIPSKPTKTKVSIPSLKLTPLSHNIKENYESRLIDASCNQELNSAMNIQKLPTNSEQSVSNMKDADFSPSEDHPIFIETETNTSDKHSSVDFPNSDLSAIQGDIGDDSLENGKKSGEIHEEFEDFTLNNESENFEMHEEEQGSSEMKTSSINTITKQSNEIEEINSVELPREDNLQNESDDSFLDASNNEFHFIPQDNDHAMEFEERDVENNAGFIELNSTENKSVPTLKEKMLQKLEDLKNDIAYIKNARQPFIESTEIRDKGNLQNAVVPDVVDTQTDTTNIHITTQRFIPTTELDDRSSSVDYLEENFGNLSKSSEASSQELNSSVEPSENIRDNSDENTDINPLNSSSETIILDSVTLPSNSEENSQIADSDLLNDSSNQDIINDQPNNNEDSLENICMADTNINVEKNIENSKFNEMSSQASESIPNVVPQPTERQSIVVQPTSLFGDNSLFRPLPNFLNLDAHIPSLDVIRSGLSGILGIEARGADDDDEVSAEFQSDDCSSVMSTGASTTNSKSIFPTTKPLEDINLDIFQLTPKSQKGLFQSRAPDLNLNSYKAKLAFPQNLGLKPLRLESSLGKNGNLLGATLTFGPERIGSIKSKMSSISSILNNPRNPSLKSSSSSLPDLGDIKTTMRAKAEDLLSSQLSVPSHTVQKVSELTDSLRSHTENTVKNIQQTLASSLSESRVRDIPFREKIAKPTPDDLLEKLSTAREDVSDKLKALHADLFDRLSSIHENIAERTTLPTLQLPLLSPINRNSNTKFRTRPKNYSKQKASISNMRNNKAGVSNLRSSASRGTDEIKVRPFKISKAASTLTPKTVEVPKLMTTSSKPPFVKPMHKASNVNIIKDSRPFETSISLDQKSIIRNNFGPKKNNPSSHDKPTLRQKFASQRITSNAPSAKGTLRNKASLGSKSRLHDLRGFASEVQPAIVPAPDKPAVTVTESIEPIQTQITRPRPKPLFTNQNLGITSQISTQKTKSRYEKNSGTHKPLVKVTSSPILSKMRESLLSRSSSQASSPINTDDMSISATENRALEVIQEPLKENVKYRCRMICVKEPIQ